MTTSTWCMLLWKFQYYYVLSDDQQKLVSMERTTNIGWQWEISWKSFFFFQYSLKRSQIFKTSKKLCRLWKKTIRTGECCTGVCENSFRPQYSLSSRRKSPPKYGRLDRWSSRLGYQPLPRPWSQTTSFSRLERKIIWNSWFNYDHFHTILLHHGVFFYRPLWFHILTTTQSSRVSLRWVNWTAESDPVWILKQHFEFDPCLGRYWHNLPCSNAKWVPGS